MSLSSAQCRCGQKRIYMRVTHSGKSTAVTSVQESTLKPKAAYGSYLFASMARGHQKIQSQQKNAKKQAEAKKSKGHDQKTAAKAALVFTCGVCRSQMPDPKTFKQHFESKHPKSPLPPELEGVEA
ncbi:zinc finger protein 706 [Pseudorasbora parva]|uniref:zinc finger protein 706 n=1 Tax=Pseudorasbora parva TaxID=51549 RepID=UPI00351E54B3